MQNLRRCSNCGNRVSGCQGPPHTISPFMTAAGDSESPEHRVIREQLARLFMHVTNISFRLADIERTLQPEGPEEWTAN